jgi:hypothetical protein
MKQLGFNSTDFHEIWYLTVFRILVEKVEVPLKSDKNNGFVCLFVFGATAPSGPGPPHSRGF